MLSAGIPAYVLGILVLIIVMVVHGGSVLQIAKRYEVKSYLYLSDFHILCCGFMLITLAHL